MFAGLRHHALVGCDDQQHDVDPGGAGDHRAHEPLVPGNVDNADAQALGQVQWREAQLDGDAPGLLFGQIDRCRLRSGRRSAPSCRGRCVRRCRVRAGGSAGSNAIPKPVGRASGAPQAMSMPIRLRAGGFRNSATRRPRRSRSAVPFKVWTSSLLLRALPLEARCEDAAPGSRCSWKRSSLHRSRRLSPRPGIQASMSNLR